MLNLHKMVWEIYRVLLDNAIPLPGTGAWTGTLIATALRMRFLPSFLVVTAELSTTPITRSTESFIW